MHLEVLVEEISAAAALECLLPKIAPNGTTYTCHPFQGKPDLVRKLPERMRGYASWLPSDWRILILLDRDDDDCKRLKQDIQDIAMSAGFHVGPPGAAGVRHCVRLCVEELEAWFLGDVPALVKAFPRFPSTLAQRRGFRDSDGVVGGTWEKLERVFQQAGYYRAGMPKIEVARRVAAQMDPFANRSRSFTIFRNGISKLLAGA
jgi:hypothetical protein